MATTEVVKEWSEQHLLELLRDPRMPSQTLSLKHGLIEVRREVFEGDPCIVKRYLGDLSQRQQYELQQLTAVGGVSELHTNIASVRNAGKRSTYGGRESILHTRWHGLDTYSWQRLAWATLGAESPFLRNAPFLLAWIRGVLKACERFHELGFVHCDLLPQNIVLRHRTDDAAAGRYTLLLDQPFIFDLEFCLAPQKWGAWGSGQVRDGWFDDNGLPQCLAPDRHSELICASEIHYPKGKGDAFAPLRQHRMDGGYLVLKDPPFANLDRVDWGVDLFTLGLALDDMLTPCEFTDLYGQPIAANDPIDDYLRNLPKKLRSYNQLAPTREPRPTPHAGLCADIDALLRIYQAQTGVDPNEWPVNLPRRIQPHAPAHAGTGAAPQAAHSTYVESLVAARPRPQARRNAPTPTQAPTPPPTPPTPPTPRSRQRAWVLGLAGLGVLGAGGGAAWLGLGGSAPSSSATTTHAEPKSGTITAAPVPTPIPTPVAGPATASVPAAAPVAAPVPAAPPPPPPAPAIPTQVQALVRQTNSFEQGSEPWQNAVNELHALCRTQVGPNAPNADITACRSAWGSVQQAYIQISTKAKDASNPWWNGGYLRTEPPSAMRNWLAATRTLAGHGLWVAEVDQAMGDTVGLRRKISPQATGPEDRAEAARTLARLVARPADDPTPGGWWPSVPATAQREWRNEGAETLWALAQRGREGPPADPLTREAAAVVPTDLAVTALQAVAQMPSQSAQSLLGYSLACWQNQPREAQQHFARAAVPEAAGNPAAVALAKEAQLRLDRLKKGGSICPQNKQG